jgi:hypothetical protein
MGGPFFVLAFVSRRCFRAFSRFSSQIRVESWVVPYFLCRSPDPRQTSDASGQRPIDMGQGLHVLGTLGHFEEIKS